MEKRVDFEESIYFLRKKFSFIFISLFSTCISSIFIPLASRYLTLASPFITSWYYECFHCAALSVVTLILRWIYTWGFAFVSLHSPLPFHQGHQGRVRFFTLWKHFDKLKTLMIHSFLSSFRDLIQLFRNLIFHFFILNEKIYHLSGKLFMSLISEIIFLAQILNRRQNSNTYDLWWSHCWCVGALYRPFSERHRTWRYGSLSYLVPRFARFDNWGTSTGGKDDNV